MGLVNTEEEKSNLVSGSVESSETRAGPLQRVVWEGEAPGSWACTQAAPCTLSPAGLCLRWASISFSFRGFSLWAAPGPVVSSTLWLGWAGAGLA